MIWPLTLHAGLAQGVTFAGAQQPKREDRRNIYELIVLEHAQVEGKPMYIFNQIGLLKNTCIRTKEIRIESQFNWTKIKTNNHNII